MDIESIVFTMFDPMIIVLRRRCKCKVVTSFSPENLSHAALYVRADVMFDNWNMHQQRLGD